jgi:hypothetical protein
MKDEHDIQPSKRQVEMNERDSHHANVNNWQLQAWGQFFRLKTASGLIVPERPCAQVAAGPPR